MLESAWLFTGFVAICATGVALGTQTYAARIMGNADGIAIVSGILGLLTWGIFAFGALNVEVVGDTSTYTYQIPSVTILAIALALVPGYIALTGPAELIRRAVREPETDRV